MKKRGKPYKQKRRSPDAHIRAMRFASVEPQSADVHLFLSGRAYASIQKLTDGTFDRSDYSDIFKLILFAGELVAQVFPGLDDESRETLASHKDDLAAASEAVSSIGQRYMKTERFGASGSELAAIRGAVLLMDTLVAHATIGETVRAMRDADAIANQLKRNLHVPESQPN